MDCTIDAAAAQQRLMGGIDDGIDGKRRDIGLLDNDPLHCVLRSDPPCYRMRA